MPVCTSMDHMVENRMVDIVTFSTLDISSAIHALLTPDAFANGRSHDVEHAIPSSDLARVSTARTED